MKAKLTFALMLAIGLLASTSHAQSIVDRHGKLHVDGVHIKDECGRIAQMKGPSYFWSQWDGKEFWNADAIGWMVSDWKIQIIRAAMGVRSGDCCDYLGDPTDTKAQVEAVVNGAIQHGIYVIIDWHSHEMRTDDAKAFFAEMAQEFGSYPNVLYEIYNEPTGSSWTDLDETWPQLKQYSKEVIAAIRQYDPDNIIICPTPFYDQFVNQAADDPLTVDANGNPVGNVAYTLHVYADAHKFDADQGDWAREALSKGLPMIVTECGATGTQYNQSRSTGINAPNYTEFAKWENWWDQNGISYCKWSLSTKDEFGSSLLPGASATGNWDYNNDLTDEGRWNRDHFRAVNTMPSACSQSQAPYFGSPQDINDGSTIKAYTYDLGGQDVAFNDTDDGDHDGCSRTDNVDLAGSGSDCNIGWIVAGEWVEYTVNVTAGKYNIKAYMASPYDNKTMRIKLGGTTLGTVDCPSSSTGWNDYKVATLSNKQLSGGEQVLRLEMVDGSFNFQKLVFQKVNTYSATKYEAENASLTGTSVATDISGYSGSGYVRDMDHDGDKMTFTVNVPNAGTYPLTIRYSECNDQHNYVVVNGTSTDQTFPDVTSGCGGWDDKTVNVSLNAGSNTIAIQKNWGYMPVDYIIVGVPSGARIGVEAVAAEAQKDYLVYPNPITNQPLTVQLAGNKTETANVSIVDLMGSTIYEVGIPANQQLTVPVNVFKSNGTFILRIKAPSYQKNYKIVVKR